LEPTGRYSTLVQKSVNPQEVKHEWFSVFDIWKQDIA
jgi:hypothetical protein